jgi:signal transduction histidine kinase
MQDISLHLLDIIENSFNAGARTIEIKVIEDRSADFLSIEVTDDGEGMDDMTVQQALDPFFTTKHGKKVGLGLSLLSQASRETGGSFTVRSSPDKGTSIRATFILSHPDRKPLGDIEGTVGMMKFTHPEIHFNYTLTRKGEGI